VVTDAGYWHQAQMEDIVTRGIQVLVPPAANKRKSAPAAMGRRPLSQQPRWNSIAQVALLPFPPKQERRGTESCSGGRP